MIVRRLFTPRRLAGPWLCALVAFVVVDAYAKPSDIDNRYLTKLQRSDMLSQLRTVRESLFPETEREHWPDQVYQAVVDPQDPQIVTLIHLAYALRLEERTAIDRQLESTKQQTTDPVIIQITEALQRQNTVGAQVEQLTKRERLHNVVQQAQEDGNTALYWLAATPAPALGHAVLSRKYMAMMSAQREFITGLRATVLPADAGLSYNAPPGFTIGDALDLLANGDLPEGDSAKLHPLITEAYDEFARSRGAGHGSPGSHHFTFQFLRLYQWRIGKVFANLWELKELFSSVEYHELDLVSQRIWYDITPEFVEPNYPQGQRQAFILLRLEKAKFDIAEYRRLIAGLPQNDLRVMNANRALNELETVSSWAESFIKGKTPGLLKFGQATTVAGEVGLVATLAVAAYQHFNDDREFANELEEAERFDRERQAFADLQQEESLEKLTERYGQVTTSIQRTLATYSGDLDLPTLPPILDLETLPDYVASVE